MSNKRLLIGITMGDPAGIGAEVTVKALAKILPSDTCDFVVYGDYFPIADAIKFCGLALSVNVIKDFDQIVSNGNTVNLIDSGLIGPNGWKYKTVDALCGKAAYEYINRAIDDAVAGTIDAVVTGPINKESLNLAGIPYPGHTEIFAHRTGVKDYAMLLTSPKLCVSHVSTHVSLAEAVDRVKKERVLHVIRLTAEAMRMLGAENPRIAVAGLNPHASEHGLFGDQEEKEIIPAIEAAKSEGYSVDGPLPPDTVFVRAAGGQYDAVVAMYHDQGHIAVKLSGFSFDKNTNSYTSLSGVNITIGLPIIRTSVDHGTAFGKAGEGRANEQSMVDAIDCAVRMANYKRRQ